MVSNLPKWPALTHIILQKMITGEIFFHIQPHEKTIFFNEIKKLRQKRLVKKVEICLKKKTHPSTNLSYRRSNNNPQNYRVFQILCYFMKTCLFITLNPFDFLSSHFWRSLLKSTEKILF